jgi:hypothetical protein
VLEIDSFANGKWTLAFDGCSRSSGPSRSAEVSTGRPSVTRGESASTTQRSLSRAPIVTGLREVSFCSLFSQHTKDGIQSFIELNDKRFDHFRPLLAGLEAAGAIIG